jgi:hypothetical protein
MKLYYLIYVSSLVRNLLIKISYKIFSHNIRLIDSNLDLIITNIKGSKYNFYDFTFIVILNNTRILNVNMALLLKVDLHILGLNY